MDPIVVQTITALQNTLNVNQIVRENAEKQLNELKPTPGYSQLLLKIVAANDVDISIRMGANLFLKNMVIARWRTPDYHISDEDAQFIKDNIIDGLVNSHPLLRAQIEYMIEVIANIDFPNNWTGLLPKLISFITSQDQNLVMAGLTGLQLAMKKFIYASPNRRKPLKDICAQILPILLKIFEFLGTIQTVESAMMQRRISKIYLYIFKSKVPEILVQPDVFKSWLSQFVRIIRRDLAPNEQAASEDDLKHCHWWLLKKCVSRILNTIFMRAGRTLPTDPATIKKLKSLYMPKFSVEVMEIYLDVLKNKSKYPVFPERYLHHLIEYFNNSIYFGVTYKSLKPMLQPFIQEILFPMICFNDKDAERWEDDPHDYLRSQFTLNIEFYDARLESINFIIQSVAKRGRANLDAIMGFCIQILNHYNSQPANERNIRQKDGALVIISALSTYLKGIKFYRDNLEAMLTLHIFPELQSPHGFLRARACTIFAEFYDVKFQNPVAYTAALKQVLMLMSDRDLPVRVKSGSSICQLILSPYSSDEIAPIIPQLLDKIFTLMGEIESEELVQSLESIIKKFKQQVYPYAHTLCQRLTETLYRLMELEKDDTDNISVASHECLLTFSTLLRATRDYTDLFPQYEVFIVPILQKLLHQDYMMYFEETFRILTCLTYYQKKISPAVWTLFPQIIALFDECAIDFIQNMVNPLDNYISYGTEEFLNPTKNYLASIVDLFKKMIDDIGTSPTDALEACKIIESVLQRCKGRVDPAIPLILESAIKRLLNQSKENNMNKAFLVYLLETVANCLYYNPQLTVNFLQTHNLVEPVFGYWFKHIAKFQRYYDKKLSVMALSSLLYMNPTPGFVLAAPNVLLTKMLEFSKDIFSIEEDIEKLEKEEEEQKANGTYQEMVDEDDSDYDEFENREENGVDIEFDTVKDHEDTTFDDEGGMIDLEDLEKLTKNLEEGGDLDDDDYDELAVDIEGENLDEDDPEEDIFNDDGTVFETPVDDVDEIEFMANAVQLFFTNNPSLAQSALNPEQQTQIQQLIQIVPVRKEKIRLEKLKEQQELEKQSNKY
eukprot:gene3953-4939_t